MPGETQLRAKRTRIKILRALADNEGIAGFSEIKSLTGLSTGSIYYHLERMEDTYVTKSQKHYRLTDLGIQLLAELDERRNSNKDTISSGKKSRDTLSHDGRDAGNEETLRESRSWDTRFCLIFLAVALLVAVVTGSQILSGAVAAVFIIHLISKNVMTASVLSNALQRATFTAVSSSSRMMFA